MPARKQASGKFIPSLDGIRAVSIAVVLLGHAHVPGVDPAIGLTVFFFLSGYLITTLLRIEFDRHGRISLRDFYLRRALRILPPLYLVLVATVILVATGAIAGQLNVLGTLAATFHLANYAQTFGYESSLPRGSGVFWSVAVEEHFYLLFPLLYIWLRHRTTDRRRQATVIAAICAAVLVWRCFLTFVVHIPQNWTYLATDSRADSILLGCLLAVAANPYLGELRMPRPAITNGMMALAAIVVVAVEYAPVRISHTVGYTLQGIGMMVVLSAVVTYPTAGVGRLLNLRPVAFVGVLSYGIYLTHRLIQIPLQEDLGFGWLATTLVSAAIVVPVAWALHVWVELPAARLRKRLSRAGEVSDEVRVDAAAAVLG